MLHENNVNVGQQYGRGHLHFDCQVLWAFTDSRDKVFSECTLLPTHICLQLRVICLQSRRQAGSMRWNCHSLICYHCGGKCLWPSMSPLYQNSALIFSYVIVFPSLIIYTCVQLSSLLSVCLLPFRLVCLLWHTSQPFVPCAFCLSWVFPVFLTQPVSVPLFVFDPEFALWTVNCLSHVLGTHKSLCVEL